MRNDKGKDRPTGKTVTSGMRAGLKRALYGGCFLTGALLAMGAEGGMVAETLTESEGVWWMSAGLGLFALPLLVEKIRGEKEG